MYGARCAKGEIALLVSPRKPKTKGRTVPNSFRRSSIGPTAFCGVVFHFLSAALALLRNSLWTLLAHALAVRRGSVLMEN